MSAPTSRDPLVVNTQDGCCWTRRAVDRAGRGLYALADVQGPVPEVVLASLAELAEHGLSSMSMDALPVPVGVEPLSLSEAQIEALVAAGDRVVNDAVHKDLCMCDAWPEKCVSTGNYFMGAWDVSGLDTAIPAVLALWEQMRGGELDRLRARVAELEAERHSTNEVLDDAVQELREKEQREAAVTKFVAARAEYITAIRNCHPDNGHDYDRWQGHAEARRQLAKLLGLPVAWPAEDAASVAKSADKLTRLLAPTQALREGDEFGLHHTYRVGRDLPEQGGER
ncbi:hypothetical protein [Streptomyces antibioticus]|uniref:hypothetical protein n=1 Tax=Streptomyces antibioticus TaxID=1890 RepID=UPI0036F60D53